MNVVNGVSRSHKTAHIFFSFDSVAEVETQEGGPCFRLRASFHGCCRTCSHEYMFYVFQVPEAGIIVTRQNTSF